MRGDVKRVVAITMAVVLVMAPLSLCANASLSYPAVIDELTWETVIEIINNLFQAWGIYSKSVNQINEWSDYLEQMLLQYLDGFPGVTSIGQWVQDWAYGYDTWGNMQGNYSMLHDIEQFGQWLMTTLGWTSGNDYAVNATYITIDGVKFYCWPFYVVFNRNGNLYDSEVYQYSFNQSQNLYPVYTALYQTDSILQMVHISDHSMTLGYRIRKLSDGDIVGSGSSNINSYRYSSQSTLPWYYGNSSINGYAFESNDTYDYDTIMESLISGEPAGGDGITVTVTNPVFPSDDPDYNQGDGFKIIINPEYPSYTVIYLEVEFPQSISIDNLPAVISPSGTQDPGFSNAFLPIKAFVNTFSDGIDLMTDIIYHCPVQVVVIAIAIIGINVVFGALHMFKEH